jgi:hypothetical protein
MSQIYYVDFKNRKVDRMKIRPSKPKGTVLTFPHTPNIFAGVTFIGGLQFSDMSDRTFLGPELQPPKKEE